MNRQLNILYIDDEAINLMLFDNLFKYKYTILTAESGKEGLDILSKHKIDIVFSDMKMPEMDGLDFIQHAKEHFPNIVYYILSGYELTNEIVDALNNKLIDKYFQKPFDMQEIDDYITKRFGME